MRTNSSSLPRIAAALLALAPVAGAYQTHADPPDVWAQAVSKQIDAHEFEAALSTSALALELWPEDMALFDLASLAALENGDKDVALWYGRLALEKLRASVDPAAKTPPPKLAELERRVAELDPLGGKGQALIDAYEDALFAVGKSVGKRKLYANAVEALTRCRDLGNGDTAEAELAKIYANKKAVEALLESGLDVPLQSKRKKRSPEQIAREDQKHVDWENCWEIKGDNYTIQTNLGLELAEAMSLAMEQMNRFYRSVFHVKERGGNTARVVISVYKSRAEFEEHESRYTPGENVLGFFVPNVNHVATYDLREHGFALSELWSTLFHESSHQFTHLISADLIPAWLNEGTASYFEGARLLPNGSVETNLVPEGRLFDLHESLQGATQTSTDSESVSLKDVVSYYQPGSYPGEYYAFGWGLVYFLLNYENEACERVYVPIYQEYMEAYGSGGKHDPFGRFVDYFVTKAKQPGVTNFEAFEQRWKKWILELHGLYFGPPSAADTLTARARKQVAAKKLDAAVESYRFALKKRPGDAVALAELGDVLAAQKNEDGALFHYRRALVAARAAVDPSQPLGAGNPTGTELAERSAAAVAKLDEEFGKAITAADTKLLAACTESANAYVAAEMPRAALSLLDEARYACGGSSELGKLRAKIAADANVDTLRWRRPRVVAGLEGWKANKAFTGADGEIACVASGPAFCTWDGELPERYRLEVKVAVEELERSAFLALYFGYGDNGLQYIGVDSRGLLEVGKLMRKWKPIEELGLVDKKMLADAELAIDVAPEGVRFFFEGQQVHERVYAPDELKGRVGFFVQNGKAKFRELRVRF